MNTRIKHSAVEVIAVPVSNVSFFKTDDSHADVTISVPSIHGIQPHHADAYYVLKRPDSIDEVAFRVALEAAFRTVAGLSHTTNAQQISPHEEKGKKKPSGTSTTNTERLDQLKRTILSESEWLSAREVSRRGGSGSDVKNPSGLPNRWKRASKIFAISSEGKDLYPAYALDIGGQPLPLIKKIIALFGETKTAWSLAVWFGTPNSWLGNKKPKDLLSTAPEHVWEAAKMTKEGPIHG